MDAAFYSVSITQLLFSFVTGFMVLSFLLTSRKIANIQKELEDVTEELNQKNLVIDDCEKEIEELMDEFAKKTVKHEKRVEDLLYKLVVKEAEIIDLHNDIRDLTAEDLSDCEVN